jgi:DNA-binding response OmpR family regulator
VSGDGGQVLRLLDRPVTRGQLRSDARAYHPSQYRRRTALYVGSNPDKRGLFTDSGPRREMGRFLVARGGFAGLRLAIDRRPRLVVLEGCLPDVDAASLVVALRQRVMAPPAPIVVLAHEDSARERARFIWSGASAYMTEPFDTAHFDKTVAMLLEVSAWR